MPPCIGMTADGRFYSFDVQAGRAAVLVLGGGRAPGYSDLVAALAAQTATLVLLRSSRDFDGPDAAAPGVGGDRQVVCQQDFVQMCGAADDRPLVAVIDRAGRLRACWDASTAAPAAIAAAALATIAAIACEAPRHAVLPAPVLAVPALFDPAFCQDLIARFEASPTYDSGVTGLGADGSPAHRLDHGKKRRRDWLLDPGDGVYEHVLALLDRRCVPGIRQAYQHEVTHTDRILVARYDDTGGYFKRHRDNTGASVAFRQFALSVNLNAEDYDGGDLLFPEFNDHSFRPATGEGLVFSASLLHEVTPVTRGRRYVLLTFLHDMAAEARRQAIGRKHAVSSAA